MEKTNLNMVVSRAFKDEVAAFSARKGLTQRSTIEKAFKLLQRLDASAEGGGKLQVVRPDGSVVELLLVLD